MSLSRRARPALALNAALATALLAFAAGDSMGSTPADAGVVDAAGPSRVADGGPVPGPDVPEEPAEAALPGGNRDAALAEAVGGLTEGTEARLSVSVLDLASGAGAGFGLQERFDTASIVKVDILAALLLLAQDEGRELSARERSLAAEMIRSSDNAAADVLWRAIGRAPGLDEANRRLGLTGTTGGPRTHWGLTQTTSQDQIALLRAVYEEDSPLGPDARAFVRGLMDTVVPGQRWGVSAAAEGGQGGEVELKNGWLPRSRTGLWDINSIGRVTADGREYLLAVVSDGNATQAAGIDLVETAARAAVAALQGPPAAALPGQ
ncbi:serine hydrolase [Streptomyces sp. DSM 44917]|uniref:Serine hydrolase n=1 Tax=Streptomyces boetiae TaxID=3075541 RepID=A0ABU2L3I9_9ACTN|nr:serine hydrolase [Streptomyces sp. DSM 44917]MDT0305981.1 serine hydrolase [Streptomyces sp. DSM 44917]